MQLKIMDAIHCKKIYLIPLMLLGVIACSPVLAPVYKISDKSYNKESIANTYRVKKGDTLYSIAWRLGIDYRTLVTANNLHEPYTILPDQRLRLVKKTGEEEVKEKYVTVKSTRSKLIDQPSTGHNNDEKLTKNADKVQQPLIKKKIRTIKKAYPNNDLKEPKGIKNGRIVADWQWPAIGIIVKNFSGKSSKTKDKGQLKQGGQGIDIVGKIGQAIYASAAGKVVYSGTGLRGLGRLIIIKHNQTFLSAYAYNANVRVKEGQNVLKSQQISQMGGNINGQALLHFEIRKNGRPVDPLKYLPKL